MPTPDTVYACIDGLATTPAVVDAAVWAAQRLPAPLALLHTLERSEPMPPVGDYSGVLGMGAQDVLLQRLSVLDEERGQVAAEAAERMLAEAQKQVPEGSVSALQVLLRHGELTDVLLEQEPGTRLFVLGSNRRVASGRRPRLDHRVESVIRNVRQPVMVVSQPQFSAPARFVVAYDGSATAQRAVDVVARSPLLRGMPGLLAFAGEPTPEVRAKLEAAREQLAHAGFEVTTAIVPGQPEEAIPALLQAQGDALLVLGAYGHSRIRQLIVGSTTTALLRLCSAPLVVLR